MKTELSTEEQLFGKITELINAARKAVVTAVNLTMVHTYFEIGKMIVENEQQGKERAAYGKKVLKELSTRLTEKFGKGFSVENLDRMRFFFKIYSSSISSTPLTKFTLSWSHYLVLMRIKNDDERSFYEIETTAKIIMFDKPLRGFKTLIRAENSKQWLSEND